MLCDFRIPCSGFRQLLRLTKALVERRPPSGTLHCCELCWIAELLCVPWETAVPGMFSEDAHEKKAESVRDVPKLPAPAVVSASASHVPAAAAAVGPASTPAPAKPSTVPDLTTIDLQRVAPAVVVQAKAAMDVAFEANRKRPGEPGYVYDIQVEFEEGSESNEWDEEED
jgi:hypothetical protein